MELKNFWKQIPKLPLSALIFYSTVLILWQVGILPSPAGIVIFLESLYEQFGYVGLFIAAFLEGIVYLGLYFPGSFIIALAIFLSEGTLTEIFFITFIVTIAWSLTCVIDYLLGRIFSYKRREMIVDKRVTKGFLFSFLHQNLLSFYFFNEGLKKKSSWKLIITPLIMFVWGLFLVSLFSLLRKPLRGAIESPYLMITFIIFWLIIAFLVEYRGKQSL